MLEVHRHENVTAFLDRAESRLLEREPENNFMLSVAYLLRDGAPPFRQPAYIATIETADNLVGTVMCPPPDGVYLSDVPLETVPTIVDQLREFTDSIPEIIGPERPSLELARHWKDGGWNLHSRLRRYVLRAVTPPRRIAPGGLRLATEADIEVLDRWSADLAREVGSKVDAPALFRAMLERGSLYLWDDDGPRCVATCSGLTPNGARVSSVYTPAAFRGAGYGANMVAAMSRMILDGGRRFALIVADADDEIPNSVYQKIGYRPLDELALVHFS